MVQRLDCAAGVVLLVSGVAGTPVVLGAEEGRMRVQLRILVPDDAFVFVARERMKSTGPDRLYESPLLSGGKRYTYEISVIHEGHEVTREVSFQAGGTVEIDFRPDFLEIDSTPAG